ncbi:hypothetical protein PMSD_01870 [Paenibacillus macquariensis subsp. defensor]|nr:hypothetical protein PMSD_01870 [Paenibacillus macquariensis subsp. defensor]
MKQNLCWVVILIILFGGQQITFADSTSETITKEISLLESYDLALKDPVNIRLLMNRIEAMNYQKDYLNWQQDELNNTNTEFIASNLPTSPELFMDQFPNYNELSKEEQSEINQLVNTQILINSSLNQLLDGISLQQQIALEKEIDKQRKTLHSNMRALESDQEKARFELDKAKELIKFYVTQKYINILSLENDLKYLSLENSSYVTQVEDENMLYQYGLSTQKSIEEIKNILAKQSNKLDVKIIEHDYYMNEFKLELGLPISQEIQLIQVDLPSTEVSLMDVNKIVGSSYDLNQIDQNINLAMKNYEAVSDSESGPLKRYLKAVWELSLQERVLLQQQLEQKVRAYQNEEKEILSEVIQFELEHNEFLKQKEDVQTRYGFGLITIKELEKNEIDLQRAIQLLQNSNLSYVLFKAKLQLASRGVVL